MPIQLKALLRLSSRRSQNHIPVPGTSRAGRRRRDNVFEGFEVTAQARYTIYRGKVVWSRGQNATLRPGHGKYIPRPAFGAVKRTISTWKELNFPRFIKRDSTNIPSGV